MCQRAFNREAVSTARDPAGDEVSQHRHCEQEDDNANCGGEPIINPTKAAHWGSIARRKRPWPNRHRSTSPDCVTAGRTLGGHFQTQKLTYDLSSLILRRLLKEWARPAGHFLGQPSLERSMGGDGFPTVSRVIPHQPKANNGGSTSTAIIKLRRLYFMRLCLQTVDSR